MYCRISIGNALTLESVCKIVTLKVQPLSLFHNKEISYRIIIPKYNEHLSHTFQPPVT